MRAGTLVRRAPVVDQEEVRVKFHPACIFRDLADLRPRLQLITCNSGLHLDAVVARLWQLAVLLICKALLKHAQDQYSAALAGCAALGDWCLHAKTMSLSQPLAVIHSVIPCPWPVTSACTTNTQPVRHRPNILRTLSDCCCRD